MILIFKMIHTKNNFNLNYIKVARHTHEYYCENKVVLLFITWIFAKHCLKKPPTILYFTKNIYLPCFLCWMNLYKKCLVFLSLIFQSSINFLLNYFLSTLIWSVDRRWSCKKSDLRKENRPQGTETEFYELGGGHAEG